MIFLMTEPEKATSLIGNKGFDTLACDQIGMFGA
jgi:hypothetical protein